MNKYILLVIAVFVLSFQSCSSQNYLDASTVDSLLTSKEFTFMATKAIPSTNDISRVMNGVTGSGASRLLDLDYGYTVEIKKEKMTSTLPYFGRTYTPSMDPDKQSYRFTSSNYSYVQSKGKRDLTVVTIRPNDISHIQKMVMQIYPNGRAYLTIEASDRQLISYDGYLMKNEPLK